MIAITKQVRQDAQTKQDNRFLDMLPRIRSQARRAFCQIQQEHKDELIQEVVVNAYCAFVRLVHRGKADAAFATPLARFAIRQVLAGRRVAAKLSPKDVTSFRNKALGIVIERLDVFDKEQGQWREALVEDRHATPADLAAARIDMAAWLRSLSPRNRRIAKILALGATTTEVACQFNLSRARISQLRELLRLSWETFHQGGQQRAARTSHRSRETFVA